MCCSYLSSLYSFVCPSGIICTLYPADIFSFNISFCNSHISGNCSSFIFLMYILHWRNTFFCSILIPVWAISSFLLIRVLLKFHTWILMGTHIKRLLYSTYLGEKISYHKTRMFKTWEIDHIRPFINNI